MSDNTLRAALYARFSTNMQREESITAQMRAMHNYCKTKGWKVVAEYADKGISGTTDRRPEFQKMISDSNKRKFDIVLVHKLDRFARNRYDSVIYKSKLQRNGVKLCSVCENLDDSPQSILLESLLQGLAEYYSANLSTECRKGLMENAYKAISCGGQTPLGYRLDENKRMIIEPHEAEAVVLIFTMYLDGYSRRQIADHLNELGYVTRFNAPFVPNSLHSILQQEKYTGVFIYNKTVSRSYDHRRNNHRYKSDEEIVRVPGGCPVIIPKEVFDRVQEKLKTSKHSGGYLGSKHFFLCSGKIFCGVCGKRFHGWTRTDRDDRVCYGCGSKVDVCGNRRELSRDKIDSFVITLLNDGVFAPMGDCEDKQKFNELPRDMPPFRTLVHRYLKQITVTFETITFEVYTDTDHTDIISRTFKRTEFECDIKHRNRRKQADR